MVNCQTNIPKNIQFVHDGLMVYRTETGDRTLLAVCSVNIACSKLQAKLFSKELGNPLAWRIYNLKI
jgi:hypothetical protein